ncbi:MAG: S9 family peptidase [Pyrinomonadaceae bacterium]|nr:S9 family peptidase [Pyrinomonadaceae bacterium]
MKTLNRVFIALTITFTLCGAIAAQKYERPPQEIVDILDAPAFPAASLSPSKDRMALLTPVTYPTLKDMAQPMLRLAGLRINPASNSRSTQRYFVGLTIQDIDSGKSRKIALPEGARLINPRWSADGKYLAVANIAEKEVELHIVETATGKTNRISGVSVNTVFGGFQWMPDQESLVVHTVPTDRGPAPKPDAVPKSPSIQETSGRAAAIRTYQDLLSSPADEAMFEYYATSQVSVVGLDGSIRKLGTPGIFSDATPSPSGEYFLTARIKKPFSYLFPVWFFGEDVEVWDKGGKKVKTIADIPLQDNLPVGGVAEGPRSYDWIPTEPASLMWAEALDGGDPRKKARLRDKLVILSSPFTNKPKDVMMIENRYSGRLFSEKKGFMWFYDYDRDTRRRRIFSSNYKRDLASAPKLISDLNVRDRYNAIGNPVMKMLPNGKSVIAETSMGVLLTGSGASPQGDRPFLRLMKADKKPYQLFRSGGDHYESVVGVVKSGGIISFITRRESSTDPPNFWLKHACRPYVKCKPAVPKKLTNFKDPTPQLRGITKKLVKYKRADGVDLSFTLYLPPDYKKGERLPALLWAYPREFTSAATAGQVSGSTNRFTRIGSYSHLFLLTQGYAILNNATVPIVGDPLTVNDTFIEQLVAGAKAAVDKGAEMGVIDPDRVGVGGHSYGAFMTAHLLANSDIFRAGIARSGAYNRTLTPFGFQSERRSFWEAPESYYILSPFMRANLINEPMLMIHGEADNNSGTYPMQSRRMFAAIRGNGGTARLVMLPFESHGYRARESIEHVLWEQFRWMDKYVKNAKPRKTP